MRGAGRAVHDLAFPDHGDLLVAPGGPVVEIHVALDHVHDLVARVGMELAAELAAPRDEGDAVGGLPEDRVGPAGVSNAAHDLTEIDRLHLVHCPLLRRRLHATPTGRPPTTSVTLAPPTVTAPATGRTTGGRCSEPWRGAAP